MLPKHTPHSQAYIQGLLTTRSPLTIFADYKGPGVKANARRTLAWLIQELQDCRGLVKWPGRNMQLILSQTKILLEIGTVYKFTFM